MAVTEEAARDITRRATTRACDMCGETVRVVVTSSGRRLELDQEPSPAGTVVPVQTTRGEWRARVLTGEELPAQETAWRRHSATCAGGEQARRRERARRPRCRVCSGLLDAVLVDRESYRTHPACDTGREDGR